MVENFKNKSISFSVSVGQKYGFNTRIYGKILKVSLQYLKKISELERFNLARWERSDLARLDLYTIYNAATSSVWFTPVQVLYQDLSAQ